MFLFTRNFRIGQIIDGSYLIEKIISGGMGRIYIAFHQNWDLRFAIKAPGKICLKEEDANLIRQEAELWNSLGMHLNLAYCYFVKDLFGVPFVFSEYLDGGNLKELLKKKLKLSLKKRLDLAIQICNGLAYAHSKGFIHQDIKPQNILLSKDGLLKVTDFGVARKVFCRQETGEIERTEGPIISTPEYASPEQWNSPDNIGFESDIFSAGLCFWEIFGGINPYAYPMFFAAIERELPDPQDLNPELPDNLCQLLKDVVSFSPEQRKAVTGYKKGCSIREWGFSFISLKLQEIYRSLFQEESRYLFQSNLDLYASHLNNRAVSFYELGDENSAIECFEEALQLDPMLDEAIFNYSFLNWSRGRITDLEFIDKIQHISIPSITSNPSGKPVEETLEIIEYLKNSENHEKIFKVALGLFYTYRIEEAEGILELIREHAQSIDIPQILKEVELKQNLKFFLEKEMITGVNFDEAEEAILNGESLDLILASAVSRDDAKILTLYANGKLVYKDLESRQIFETQLELKEFCIGTKVGFIDQTIFFIRDPLTAFYVFRLNGFEKIFVQKIDQKTNCNSFENQVYFLRRDDYLSGLWAFGKVEIENSSSDFFVSEFTFQLDPHVHSFEFKVEGRFLVILYAIQKKSFISIFDLLSKQEVFKTTLLIEKFEVSDFLLSEGTLMLLINGNQIDSWEIFSRAKFETIKLPKGKLFYESLQIFQKPNFLILESEFECSIISINQCKYFYTFKGSSLAIGNQFFVLSTKVGSQLFERKPIQEFQRLELFPIKPLETFESFHLFKTSKNLLEKIEILVNKGDFKTAHSFLQDMKGRFPNIEANSIFIKLWCLLTARAKKVEFEAILPEEKICDFNGIFSNRFFTADGSRFIFLEGGRIKIFDIKERRFLDDSLPENVLKIYPSESGPDFIIERAPCRFLWQKQASEKNKDVGWQPFDYFDGVVSSCCYNASSSLFAIGDRNGQVSLWSLEKNERVFYFQAHDSEVNSICFFRNWLLSIGKDEKGILFDWVEKKLIKTFEQAISFFPKASEFRFVKIKFSYCDRWIFIFGHIITLLIDLENLECKLVSPELYIESLAFCDNRPYVFYLTLENLGCFSLKDFLPLENLAKSGSINGSLQITSDQEQILVYSPELNSITRHKIAWQLSFDEHREG